jgi:hypothetical protein
MEWSPNGHERPLAPGKVVRRYIVEEEVISPPAPTQGWQTQPLLASHEDMYTMIGWTLGTLIRRFPFSAGVTLTMGVAIAAYFSCQIIYGTHIVWQAPRSIPVPAAVGAEVKRSAPQGRSLPIPGDTTRPGGR